MVNTTNPHYITQNATGTSLTQPVDTVDFPHSGLIKALNQMAAGNVVVKTGTDFDINQTGGNLVVAAGKILRNGKYHEVATKTFADSSLTTTYAKGYHLLVVADGREGGETVNNLYIRPPTANLRVPEFKLGDTIVALIEYSSGTSAGSRLIQYFTTNKESNSLSIAYANSNVYTQAMTVDAVAGDVTFENIVQDKDIIFKANDGGTPTEVMRVDGSTSRVGIGATAPTAKLEVSGDVDISRSSDSGQTRTLSIEGARNATGTDYARIDLENYDSHGPTSYVGARISAVNDADGVNDGSLVFSTNNANAGIAERMRIDDEGNVGIGTNSPSNKLQVSHTAADGDNGLMIVREDTTTADGDLLGGIGFDSTDGNVPSSVLESSAFIASLATEDHGTGDKGGNLKFGVSLIDENDDVVSTTLANVGPPDTTANATTYAGLNSRATTAIVAAATYAPTIEDSGTLVIFEHANSNLTLPSINNDTSVGVQFTVFNETGSDISAQIAVSNSATINGGAASALDDIASFKAATFVCSGNNTWIRIG